jgi:hypothetical protein
MNAPHGSDAEGYCRASETFLRLIGCDVFSEQRLARAGVAGGRASGFANTVFAR